MNITLVAFVAALVSLPMSVWALENPNEVAMTAEIVNNRAKIESLMTADQGVSVQLNEENIRCLGLEFEASPVGACLVEGFSEEDMINVFYSVTISFPADGSEGYEFSVKLIEAAEGC